MSRGSTLAVRSGCIQIRRPGEKLAKIPALAVRHLFLGHGVNLHPEAVPALLDLELPVSFLDRKGNLRGHLHSQHSTNPHARIAQCRLLENQQTRLQLAKNIVEAKLRNCRAQLRRIQSNTPGFQCLPAINTLRHQAKELSTTSSLDELRGREGISARVYFNAISPAFKNTGFAFQGRNRRPPLDPVNALLSYTYTFFTNELASITEALGLDTAIGCLHEIHPGQPSLALDLLEAFRPALADRFTITAIRRKEIRLEHFDPPAPIDRAVFLNKEGRRQFFESISTWFHNTFRDDEDEKQNPQKLLEKEVRSFKKALVSGNPEDWKPMNL